MEDLKKAIQKVAEAGGKVTFGELNLFYSRFREVWTITPHKNTYKTLEEAISQLIKLINAQNKERVI